MKPFPFQIVEWDAGPKGRIYTIQKEGESSNELDNFLDHPDHISSPDYGALLQLIDTMLDRTGFRDHHFRGRKEWTYPHPMGGLRYAPVGLRIIACRYGSTLVVLGGGSLKPAGALAIQDVPALDDAYGEMTYVSARIDTRRKSGRLSINMYTLEGDLSFPLHDDDL